MPAPTESSSLAVLSAEKDVIRGLVTAAAPGRERDSILHLIDRVGMHDGQLEFTQAQATFLRANLATLTSSPSLAGTKYDTPMCREIADAIVTRLGGAIAA